MNSASFSMKVFGAYIVLTGAGLLLAPALLLALFGLPAPAEVWVRVLGALAVVVGYYYYWACAAAGATAFIRASVAGRLLFCGLCVLLVLLASAPWQLLIFGALDVLGAAWTASALRGQKAP